MKKLPSLNWLNLWTGQPLPVLSGQVPATSKTILRWMKRLMEIREVNLAGLLRVDRGVTTMRSLNSKNPFPEVS